MSVPGYENYRDSGVEWLGDVPSHWDVAPGRRLFKQTRTPAASEDEQLSSTQKYGVIPQSLFMSLEGQKVVLAMSGTDAFKHVDVDDFVISLRSFQGGIERCRYAGCVSPAYTALKPAQQMNASYWEHALKSKPYIAALQSITDGIREGKTIRYEQFGWLPLPVPTVCEQAAIATFLDCETGKIDALVEAQRRLIELLKEKRQAVISHAVTKGLDPAAPMKDSGVEWLGEVPAHWDVRALAKLAKPGTTITYGIIQAGPDIEDGIPYIRTGDMSGDTLPLEGYLRTSPEIDDAYSRSKVRAGDLVIAIRATIGKPLLVPPQLEGANLTQGTARFSPGNECASEFVRYSLISAGAEAEFERLGKGATFKEITLEMLRKFRVPCPPLIEQRAIVAYLDTATRDLAALSRAAEHSVLLLQERRAALISAAVTGKIDVRGLASGEVEAA